MKKNNVLTYLGNGLKGIFIGMANAIPGVSGGTIAVITGIYEPLISALAAVGDALFSVFTGNKGWKSAFARALPVILPAGLGLVIGLVGFANIIESLSEAAPMQTQFLFMGLILGSLPFLIKQSGKTRFKPTYLIPLILGAGLLICMAIVNSSLESREALIASQRIIRTITPSSALILIVVGMLAVGTMVIPGVSGSFLLVLIGMYGTFIKMFTERNLAVIALFAVGAGVGLLLISKLISWLLTHVHGHAYFGIVGLVIGSVAVLWPGFQFDAQGASSAVAGLLGFAAAYFLGGERKANAAGSMEESE